MSISDNQGFFAIIGLAMVYIAMDYRYIEVSNIQICTFIQHTRGNDTIA